MLTPTWSELAKYPEQPSWVFKEASGRHHLGIRYNRSLVYCRYLHESHRTSQISTAEQTAILDAYTTGPANIQANGIRLANQKFFTTSAIDRTIQGKKGVCHLLEISLSMFF